MENSLLQSGREFYGSSGGAWATQTMLAAMSAGRSITAAELRTCDTLRKDEWKSIDEAVTEEARQRLNGISDLVAAGLVDVIPNAMGKTLHEFEKSSEMEPATIALSSLNDGREDRLDFELDAIPNPIVSKAFRLDLRTLQASRTLGEDLPTLQARDAGRAVAEGIETMMFSGGGQFLGKNIYGLTNFPDRTTVAFGTNGNWSQAAKTGEDILADVLSMITLAAADRHFGPYQLYIPGAYDVELDDDFKTNSDLTIRQRLLNIDKIAGISTVDLLTADNVILVQFTRDVIVLLDGEPIQTIQWDVMGGLGVRFKVMAIQTPLIRSTHADRSGVVHMS